MFADGPEGGGVDNSDSVEDYESKPHNCVPRLAGAMAKGEVTVTDSGNALAMLRDPWGFAVQLVETGSPRWWRAGR